MARGRRGGVALTAAGLGLVAGMRSMSAPALLAGHLVEHRRRRREGVASRLLASPGRCRLLRLLAAGEMVADKMPFIPARTEPMPLAGRAAMGALCGAALAEHRGGARAGAAVLGAAAAVAATFAAYHLRRAAGQRLALPDAMLGVAEDALVVGLGRSLLRPAD